MTRHVCAGLTMLAVCALLAAPRPAAAQQAPPPRTPNSSSLKRATLDDLMQIEVTSVSKKEEKLSEAPSAIFVLTHDDLLRAGVTTIAEALRLVPGLEVARIDANKWAISARGFNGRFADKMLVLIDGRSVYTPLFSGVYWDVQDTLLEDIDRIEVIRGPGATLWGANAVNGVINIITKSAQETQGAFVSLRSGVDERAVVSARYGGAVGDRAHYRLFVKYLDRGPFVDAAGLDAADDSDLLRAGGRFERRPSADSLFLVDAGAYAGSSRTTYGPGSLVPFHAVFDVSTADVTGGHVLGRWTRALAPRSEVSFQAYWDYTRRNDSLLDERRHTADVEFQHHTGALPRQDIVWGAGFRVTRDRIASSPQIAFAMPARSDELVNVFVQNEVTIVPDRLKVTGGLKLEHNRFTGWEWQPDARALVLLDGRQTIWASVSRAVRTPSRAETDVTINAVPVPSPLGVPMMMSLRGRPTFASETLRAHELGYRIRPTPAWSFDVAVFANEYDHLRTFEPADPVLTLTPEGPLAVVPVWFDNQMSGSARGLEAVARWEPVSLWRVDATYTFIDVSLRHHPGSRDAFGILVENATPGHQGRVRTGLTLARDVDVDVSVAVVGAIDRPAIPRYTRLDARLAWRPGPQVTLEIGGRNLLDARHEEFGSALGEVPTRTPRSLFAGLSWLF